MWKKMQVEQPVEEEKEKEILLEWEEIIEMGEHRKKSGNLTLSRPEITTQKRDA